MLDVECAIDVDTCVEQLLHILPALLVAAAGGVAVGQFVHHGDGWLARQQAVEVHLLQPLLTVHVDLARLDGEFVEQGQGLLTAVGLHHADQDVDPLLGLFPHRLQHGVGLAHAGGGPEKDFQLALVLLLQTCQQGVSPYLITHAYPYRANCPRRKWRSTPDRQGAPSGALLMIQLQVQLENVDHLRAKDTSLCGRLDLLRQLGGIQSTFSGDAIHLRQHRIEW